MRRLLLIAISISLICDSFSYLHRVSFLRSLERNIISICIASSLQVPFAYADSPPSTTARVTMDFSIARGASKPVLIDIYGTEAPIASKIFLSICRGDNPYGVSYDESQVSKVIKDKEITVDKFYKGTDQKQITEMDSVGKVRIKSVDLAEKVTHIDSNALLHDRGTISVPKGGKSFAFSVSLGANDQLDESNVVIGHVAADEGGVLEDISSVATSKEDALGMKGGFAALGKAGGDGRAKLASVDRPLKKIGIRSCSVDSVAQMATFMRLSK